MAQGTIVVGRFVPGGYVTGFGDGLQARPQCTQPCMEVSPLQCGSGDDCGAEVRPLGLVTGFGDGVLGNCHGLQCFVVVEEEESKNRICPLGLVVSKLGPGAHSRAQLVFKTEAFMM